MAIIVDDRIILDARLSMRLKEKLLLLSLGRQTTPFEAAKRVLLRTPSPSEMGQWYTVKNELKKSGFIIELPQTGRMKPIKANVPKYFETILKSAWPEPCGDYKTFFHENTPLFEKYAARIVDFILNCIKIDEATIVLPFSFYLLVRAAIASNYIPKQTYNAIAPFISGKIATFVATLTENEARELKPNDPAQAPFLVCLASRASSMIGYKNML
ncbi:MAG: hypothetical protein QXS29_05985 [Nitrososphaeria archaeon]